MKKSERRKASKHEDGIDLISNMPDHILVLILSRLPSTEEAIRSSILSRRWRYLWTEIPSLYINCFGDRHQGNFKKNKFKQFVSRGLVNKSVDLVRFQLHCSTYYSMSTVGQWIHAAVTRKVKHLDLAFCPKKETQDIELPQCLVTCASLKVLSLNLYLRGLRLPNIKGFPALRALDLTNADLLEDGDLAKDFFQSCPLLEDLTLSDCLTCKLGFLCISCPKLKRLSIMNIGDVDLCSAIKISCPKLEFLELGGHLAYSFFFECLDSLKEAEIEPIWMGNTVSVLFPGISHVVSLRIDLHFFCQCINATRDPGLPNLKMLALSTTIAAFSIEELNRIFKYYPKLESVKLIIKEELHGRATWELYQGDARRILTSDVESIEVLEYKGEKPKIHSDDEMIPLEIVFSWGNKAKYSH